MQDTQGRGAQRWRGTCKPCKMLKVEEPNDGGGTCKPCKMLRVKEPNGASRTEEASEVANADKTPSYR